MIIIKDAAEQDTSHCLLLMSDDTEQIPGVSLLLKHDTVELYTQNLT